MKLPEEKFSLAGCAAAKQEIACSLLLLKRIALILCEHKEDLISSSFSKRMDFLRDKNWLLRAIFDVWYTEKKNCA